MLEKIDYINLYIASKKMLCDDIFVNPNNGDIYRDCNGYQQRFSEYIRNDKLYIVIDGIMYNKAKLIYDSVNKDNLPNKRYKVIILKSHMLSTIEVMQVEVNTVREMLFLLDKYLSTSNETECTTYNQHRKIINSLFTLNSLLSYKEQVVLRLTVIDSLYSTNAEYSYFSVEEICWFFYFNFTNI